MARKLKILLSLVCGAIILAFGLYNIHGRTAITEGGVLGMTLLLDHWLGISPGISGIIMDITCYAFAFKILGLPFVKKALVASVSFSVSYQVFERIGYALPDLSAQPILAAVIGALFVGCGVGLVVRVGGACGGDDALALAIAHVTKWPIARAYLATDISVLLLSLSYIPPVRIVYSLITVTISSVVIGRFSRMTKKSAT